MVVIKAVMLVVSSTVNSKNERERYEKGVRIFQSLTKTVLPVRLEGISKNIQKVASRKETLSTFP